MWPLPLLFAHASLAFAATAGQWRGRSIYQVMTDRFARTDNSTTYPCDTSQREYCGGTWQGLINQLDYIKGMGFSAVWISPVTHQTPIPDGSYSGQSYHGYWQDDLYSVNAAFGSADDLKALSAALHQRDMYLMVDVVANHFSWPGNENSVDYSSYNPFNQAEYFHPFCQIQDSDYTNNQTAVEDCWLGDNINQLTDLNTQSDIVKKEFQTWIQQLVSNYSIDGLRIDTVRNVQPDFWSTFVASAGVFALGEVFDGDISYTCPYQTALGNSSSTPSAGLLNYPAYFSIINAFKSNTTGNLTVLASSINSIKSTCPDSNLLGSFLENHDNPRFPNLTSDVSLTRNAIAFTLLADGIPIIYQGQEQHFSGGSDPSNREALWPSNYNTSNQWYTLIARLNALRNTAVAHDPGYAYYKAWPIYNDTHTLVMRKGSDTTAVIGVYTNVGSDPAAAPYTLHVANTGYASEVTVVEVLACQKYTTNSDGSLDVEMSGGDARVFYPAAALAGSGVCTGVAGRAGMHGGSLLGSEHESASISILNPE